MHLTIRLNLSGRQYWRARGLEQDETKGDYGRMTHKNIAFMQNVVKWPNIL